MKFRVAAICILVSALAGAPAVDAAANPRALYTQALARERALRHVSRKPTLTQLRSAVSAYEALASKFPSSGYSDNALWQAANLAFLAFDRFGQQADKRTGVRLLAHLKAEYPSSSLIAEARNVLRERERAPVASIRAASPAAAIATVPSPPAAVRLSNVRPRTGDLSALPRFMPPVLTSAMKPVSPAAPGRPADAAVPAAAPVAAPVALRSAATAPVSIREVTRTSLPDGMRVTIEMDGEATYYAERLENPRRVFFDLRGARASSPLQDASLRFTDDIVREIRLGRHPNATRVVMDMVGAESYSVFTLYDPFRLVIDFKRSAAPAPPPASPLVLPPPMRLAPAQEIDSAALLPIAAAPPPSAPAVNRDGTFSLARQLGLGISRIVIDAGHGGHDPGARSNGLTESEVTLDVALRLSRLLQKVPGVEVVMTRATDVFIPLEERTAIANREGADLFLSIHANASRNAKARGVETYFLNFASNPEAEAVAARENAGSAQTMHRLPEIVRAIALNNKLDESRDFAEIVQKSMVRRLSTRNKQLRDLGVKQAPFVVLIGAEMPSVLAEMAFVTHKQEGTLLKTGAYRQQIAESLLDAVLRYQQSLKQLRRGTSTQATTK